MTKKLHGTITALITPFTKDGSGVDLVSLNSLIEYQIDQKVDGIVACGSTGEAATLSDDEYRAVVERTVAVTRGRVPVIAGIGTNSTVRAKEIASYLSSKLSAEAGDAIMVVAPPYNKPTQVGLIRHFEAVRSTTHLPILAYNVPGRTGVNILPSTFGILAREGVINAVKEASGNVDQIGEAIAQCGDQAAVLSGDDSLTLPVMVLGAQGIVSVVSNVAPRLVRAVTENALLGRWDLARKAHFELLPLAKALFMESNPIPVKAAAKIAGLIADDAVRLPLTPATNETREKLIQLLRNHA